VINYGIYARTFGFNPSSRSLSGCCGVSGWRRTMNDDMIFLVDQVETLVQFIVWILNDMER
jgi:hypothetical protein